MVVFRIIEVFFCHNFKHRLVHKSQISVAFSIFFSFLCLFTLSWNMCHSLELVQNKLWVNQFVYTWRIF